MRKRFKILLLLFVSLFTMLNGVSAAKPGSQPSGLEVTSSGSFKNIILTYELVNAKKSPDKYVIKRGALKVYEGRNTSFNDTSLRSGTNYTYTVEAWLNGKIMGTANHQTSTASIVVQSIDVTAAVKSDQSVVISWPSQYSGLAPNQYKIFVDGILRTAQPPLTSSTQTTTILDLQPGNHLIKIEGWYKDEIVSQGSETVFIPEPVVPPHKIEIYWDTQDFNSRQMQIYFSYDDSLQPADRMVITRKKVTLVNGIPTEDSSSEVIYDGEPIAMYTETQFSIDVVGYNYYVVNYQNDKVVGSGNGSVPNFFDY